MIKIELVDISNSKLNIDKWGNQTSNPVKTYKSIFAKEIELTINENYNIVSLNKYKEQKQFLIHKFEYEKQEKIRLDNVEWDIIRVKTSPKNSQKLLLVVVRE